MLAGNQFRPVRTIRPGVARVDARLHDFAFPAHSHEHVCIGLMHEGALSSRYGRHRRLVARHDVILVNPGEVHDGRPAGRRGRGYSMLEIDAETFRRICLDAVGRDWIDFHQPLRRDTAIRRALATWLAALSGADDEAEREAAALLFGLLSSESPQLQSREHVHDLASRARHRLLAATDDADSIGGLATEIGASRYQLIRAFKVAFGLTPEDYRRQLRVSRARRLLAGPRALAEIAALAGFSDQSHMSREFRRLVGATPAVYRQALR